ncbi:hypothetical protein FRC12_002571 [Ceratobasidium sp. 428]|nr:hypothetical protein FRC12_002571 [Ceratobasidium sp. 428]
MSVISPQAMLLWATLSSTLLLFLIQHLYRYDRFQCLKWRSSSDGGFKRFMTYSYIISVPLLTVYSMSMAVMKYQAGYITLPNPASTPAHPLPRIAIPAPTEMWPKYHQNLIFPLYVIFAVAWALEIVSHLEELCFWLFMIREQGEEGEGGVRPWFKSFEYKLWCCGSVAAMVLLPVVTIETRNDLEQVEAWTFFTGSVGSLAVTIWFMQVLWKFPSFLKRIRAENADPEVIVRLMAFQDLNRLRVVFRLMFVVPLLILACDGIRVDGPHVIAKTAGAVDILAMVGGIGCVVSSVITLLIFFPRSIAREAGYATRARTHSSQMQSKSGHAPVTKGNPVPQQHQSAPQQQHQSVQSQRDASYSIQHREILSPGSSNFPYSPGFPRSPGIASQLQNQSIAETSSLTRPQPAHRRTMSGSPYAGSPTTPVPSDPLTGTASYSRHPYISPATPEVGPGVHVTIQTAVRGDSTYFNRQAGGKVVLGDEELPAYIGDGLSDSKRRSSEDEDEEQRLPPHPNQRYHTGNDVFASSGPSVIRMGSVNGSQVPLTRGVSLRGRARGLHPLLVNYTSPIDLHISDDAQIGRAL